MFRHPLARRLACRSAFLAAAALAAHGAASAGAPFGFEPVWYKAEFGNQIGGAGMVFVDWRGDGQAQLVAAASRSGFAANRYWYVIEHHGRQLDTGFATLDYPADIAALLAIDADGDGDQELLLAHGTTFEIWDAEASARPQLVRSTTVSAAGWIRGLAYADVDEDGRAEFVFCSGGALWAFDSVTGDQDLRLQLNDVCVEVAVGDVDEDSHLEIAASNGWSGSGGGLVVDGATSEIQWQSPDGFGSTLRIGDVDGDGIGEIVGGGAPGRVRIFDAMTESQRLDLGELSYGASALRLFDTDGDGIAEILYGTSLGWIRVAAGDGEQLAEIRNHPWPEVGDIAYGDSDGDGAAELIWSGGYGSSADDRLFVWDRSRLEATTVELDAPYFGFAAGDIDADGSPEIVHTVYSTAGSSAGRVIVRDAASHQEEAMLIPATSGFEREATRLALGQLDGDAPLEIVVAAGRRIVAFDGLTLAPQWEAPIPANVRAMGLQIADLDGDGQLEVVAASQRANSNSSPAQRAFSVFAGRSGALAWQSPEIAWAPDNFAYLRIANLDGDASLEIVVGEDDGGLEIWDGASHLRQLAIPGLRVTALETADVDGNGIAELYVGSAAGELRRFDPASGLPLASYGTYAGAIQGLAVRDLDADGWPELVFTVNGKVLLYEGGSGQALWRSAKLAPAAARHDGLQLGDFDGDGALEIRVDLGDHGQMIFERADPLPID